MQIQLLHFIPIFLSGTTKCNLTDVQNTVMFKAN